MRSGHHVRARGRRRRTAPVEVALLWERKRERGSERGLVQVVSLVPKRILYGCTCGLQFNVDEGRRKRGGIAHGSLLIHNFTFVCALAKAFSLGPVSYICCSLPDPMGAGG